MFDLKEIITIGMILFAVIDIVGSIPVIISLKKSVGHIQSENATIVAGIIMIAFVGNPDGFLGSGAAGISEDGAIAHAVR